MRARLAKKIIKASDVYWYYRIFCGTCENYKPNPYWEKHWTRYNLGKRYALSVGLVPIDERLDAALRRLPRYVQKLSSTILSKYMEAKGTRILKIFERVKARQNFREESCKNGEFSISCKMESL